jgi:hypothetical protein
LLLFKVEAILSEGCFYNPPPRGSVVRPEDIREYLRRRPFQPFRLTLTDGRTYDVTHPELAMVGRSSVLVGLKPAQEAEPIFDRAVDVSLLRIMQIGKIETASPPASN